MKEYSLDVRKGQDLVQALEEADSLIMKKYMNGIAKLEVKEISEELAGLDLNSVVRMNKVERLVFQTDENNLDKLMNVYNAVGLCGGSIINIIISDGKNVEYYVGTKADDINHTAVCQSTLWNTLRGNFPGTAMAQQKKHGFSQCMERTFEHRKAVSVVSGIPGYKDQNNKENAKFVQGIERVVDSMKGQKYALLIISDPLGSRKVTEIRENYEKLYTQLSPFATSQMSYAKSDSNAVAETITEGITKTVGDSISNTTSNSSSSTSGENNSKSLNITPFGIGGSFTWGTSSSFTSQEGSSYGETKNSSTSSSDSKGKTDTYTQTSNQSLQITIENKTVKNLMQKLDKLMERIDDSADLGLWNTAAYCIAEDSQTSRVLGNAVEAICRGEKASIENFVVDTWDDSRKSRMVQDYLKKLSHPVLLLERGKKDCEITPSSLVNGKELVLAAGIPQKSIPGLPVSEMVPFSRNVVQEGSQDNEKISLGKIYHMGSVEETEVSLDVESLASHTLITGSTGAGKSNTVYHLLDKMCNKGVHFLVVEPAKGEYKHVFGNRKNVHVYGTNERLSELLQINPFQFPETIHVLEHIDRLVEIFQVCWPMYAAMPAVLKDAVLHAYTGCGWNLEDSKNSSGSMAFPSFKDLQRELVRVIERSAYSEEVKGNYIGSLVTRVKSLTNGINGRIFTDEGIPYGELFDKNVIVDLSRVGSSETKSLIMGILVMALNEYRMDQAEGVMNQKLKHVTVLEEAHNLLRNASFNTGGEEGGNLAGKSVEMLSNSIAEMRTYGEGFFIVDQSPGAIDISAIRNTNTKIILRLPEESDRQQAGKSAALNEKQTDELAKLHQGVAVVYQNNWLNPVLCKVNRAGVTEEPYDYTPPERKCKADDTELLAMLMKNRIDEKVEYDIDRVEAAIKSANLSAKTKLLLQKTIQSLRKGEDPELLLKQSFPKLASVVVEVLDCQEHFEEYLAYGEDCGMVQQELSREIEQHAKDASDELKLAVSQCILREMVGQDAAKVELYAKWREYAVEQRRIL